MSTERHLPSFDELPNFHDFTGCAWGVWGADDQLGTVNLLTEDVVKRAAQEEIKLGKTVCLNWPINFPDKPVFGRKIPHVESKAKGDPVVRDDEIYINTQSGSQWDGLKHFGIRDHLVFYNNTADESLPKGHFPMPDPNNLDPLVLKLGIHNWAQHGICGRGVLLDLVKYFTASGSELPYDPWSSHAITVADLQACAKQEGVEFRTGDILLLRVGFIQKYYQVKTEERDALRASRSNERLIDSAGIEQSEDMKRFLWNNHFAAVASDQPALERWPPVEGKPHMHQFLLWGMPIGEFFDLEKLSTVCAEAGRYTFFFSSWPLNVLGGIASPPNAAAYL
ncbi:hypothetical protein JAAARDRAFT_56849 [Jaapia argillacea MUCL 33604]|uniref:Cyclase n=1 Tax=Jaapia argillacea MUCL 33604 TaxID=933084 RepID=A0A067Q1E0_9AGAM|nr:hypothetical protein JAAARDRAFT_56849 [Jaapia argillacea MUCL 33604]